MLLKYLDGPHKILEWGNKSKYFLFRPTCEVPEEFGKLILSRPEKAGRFEEVKPQTEAPTQGTSIIQAELPQQAAFVCDICQKPVKSKAGLFAHKRKHKDQT